MHIHFQEGMWTQNVVKDVSDWTESWATDTGRYGQETASLVVTGVPTDDPLEDQLLWGLAFTTPCSARGGHLCPGRDTHLDRCWSPVNEVGQLPFPDPLQALVHLRRVHLSLHTPSCPSTTVEIDRLIDCLLASNLIWGLAGDPSDQALVIRNILSQSRYCQELREASQKVWKIAS